MMALLGLMIVLTLFALAADLWGADSPRGIGRPAPSGLPGRAQVNGASGRADRGFSCPRLTDCIVRSS